MVKMETHFIKCTGLCRISEVFFGHARLLPFFKMAHGMSCKDRAKIFKDSLQFEDVRIRILVYTCRHWSIQSCTHMVTLVPTCIYPGRVRANNTMGLGRGRGL